MAATDLRGRVTTRACDLRLPSRDWELVVEDLGRLAHLESSEDLPLAIRRYRALRDAALIGPEGDEVHALELVSDVSPGVAGCVLDDSDEEQPEPAELDMGVDAVLAVVEHRSEPRGPFHVSPPVFNPVELFVGLGEIGRGEAVVGNSDEPLAVEVGIFGDGCGSPGGTLPGSDN